MQLSTEIYCVTSTCLLCARYMPSMCPIHALYVPMGLGKGSLIGCGVNHTPMRNMLGVFKGPNSGT